MSQTNPSTPTTKATTSGSLLLNQSNLVWSQPPTGSLQLVSPSPSVVPALVDQTIPPVATNFRHLGTSSLSSSVSTLNTSELDRTMSNLDRLTVTDTASDSQSVIDNLSTHATIGSAASNEDNLQIASSSESSSVFQEIEYHWFYQKHADSKEVWEPFSLFDNYNLEYAFQNGMISSTIATNGTRFDVDLFNRTRKPVYWAGPETKVQRCSWFFKRDSDFRFVPYGEEDAELLEMNYRECFFSKSWNRRVYLANNDFVLFYAPNSIYHYLSDSDPQAGEGGWTASLETHYQPRYAYRGMWLTDTSLERGEGAPVDHLIFFIHGIGEICDFSFRKLVDVVDDFRTITADMVCSHFAHHDSVGRVEVLPILWHSALHTQHLDAHLSLITLPSIPKMRSFTNDTIMDALFYTSDKHAQKIVQCVASELNRLYAIFRQRNPHFAGSVAIGGHSLGSLISFDLLSHQASQPDDQMCKTYPEEQIQFKPACLFALGSPIPVFLSMRGIHELEDNFKFPTCSAFYNIFHPFDPIAYRFEPLINKEFAKLKPLLIPHHKGRKRLHYVVRDSIVQLGSDLKQKLFTSIKSTFNSLYDFALAHRQPTLEAASFEADEVMATAPVAEESSTEGGQPQVQQQQPLSSMQNIVSGVANLIPQSIVEPAGHEVSSAELLAISSQNFGQLNGGRRIDYVLQERPIEVINEYLFAIASHCCYWLSEDTALLILRELYGQVGVTPLMAETSGTTATEPEAIPIDENVGRQQQQQQEQPPSSAYSMD